MFEISAKAYCNDHAATPGAPQATKADGSDRKLADVLRDIYNYMVTPVGHSLRSAGTLGSSRSPLRLPLTVQRPACALANGTSV